MSGALYIGIMSGTSLDGIDVVVVDFNRQPPHLIAAATTPYSHDLKQHIENLVNSATYSLSSFCQLDVQIAKAYASSVLSLLKKKRIKPSEIIAIGCHGQTIKHDPNREHAYTLQIGDPNTLVALSNITTVADFRRKDVALGGQGAPFAPAFHQYAFQSRSKNRAIINIGGIANLSVLPAQSLKQEIIGFDTGPGNTLIDHFCWQNFNAPYDKNGDLAARGHAHKDLIEKILNDEPYFSLLAGKSTASDYFNLDWYAEYLKKYQATLSPLDSIATLTELTALSIANSINTLSINIDEIFYCGGGQLNATLMKKLATHTRLKTISTEELGIHPAWVEAIAFAWFAKNTLENKTINLSSVTSANRNAILGAVFKA